MSHESAVVLLLPPTKLDYSLTGENASRAVERGLAEADWYQCPVARSTMRQLLQRRDGPAVRDTLIWFALIAAAGLLTVRLWPHGYAALPYLCYAVLYASTADSRWHEAGHGTAFKTDWLNTLLYEVASFMVMRESTVWRWSHTRHHSDTIIVGRDPEIAVPRPPDIAGLFKAALHLPVYKGYFKHVVMHALGRMTADEQTFIPATEFPKIFAKARVYLAIYAGVIGSAAYSHSVLPVLLVGGVNLFGTWLMLVYGLTQHTGLAENVLDHRLNCRTVYMNAVHRFLYWNMNYHVEHHMFPLVPYHALPRLHEAVKGDCPTPYPSLLSAWREIVPAVRRQVRDPAHHVKRVLPEPRPHAHDTGRISTAKPDAQGWVEVGPAADLGVSDVMRFDHGRRTYAIARDGRGAYYGMDGMCTHGNVHLAQGLVKGGVIECSKHNGRFFLDDGSPARTPICRGLTTYRVEARDHLLFINVGNPRNAHVQEQRATHLRVVSNTSVSTFIKELVLEPLPDRPAAAAVKFAPGDYMQLDVPTYERIAFRDLDIPQPYAAVWEQQHVFDLVATNAEAGRRNNYSLASNAATEPGLLRFNVRIATPPPGQACPPGAGSSWMFNLRPGDPVSAVGPFGDFHIKPTQREMVYIGGGAGMAPLRAHLSHLFETEHTKRKVSFWYGARSRQEVFYADYFQAMAAANPNFSFNLALSSPLPEDGWTGHAGFIHEVVLTQYLNGHPDPRAVEFYLCGPPMMIKACTKMLEDLGVPVRNIAFDEF